MTIRKFGFSTANFAAKINLLWNKILFSFIISILKVDPICVSPAKFHFKCIKIFSESVHF